MTTDDRTPGRNYPLPSSDNKLKDDVVRLRSAFTAIDVDITALLLEMGLKSDVGHGHVINDVVGLRQELDGKVSIEGFSLDLNNLADVNAPTPANLQVLMRVGAMWTSVSLQVNHVSGLEASLTAIANDTAGRWNTAAVSGAATKATPADTDVIPLVDSVLKKLTWANLKAALKGYFDGLYALVGHNHNSVYSLLAHVHAAATTSADGFMSAADKTKLNGVAAGAQVNPTAAVIKTTYESNANTNAYTDAEKTKLAGVAAGATANATDAANRARGNHTGTQAISTVVGLQTALDGKVGSAVCTHNTGINELGSIVVTGSNAWTYDCPGPWVMAGLRSEGSRIYIRAVQVRNN